ncbi:MAG: hypothetical protein K2N95_11000 [Lachnospiraceae bacterium]|nr:hypothetical protein [Lachnospiraceae bacterium]
MAPNENERRTEAKMRQYAAECVKFATEMKESGKKEERIKALMQISPLPRTRGKRWNFVLEQIGYLGRYCLVWQVVWGGLFWYLMRHGIPYISAQESENGILMLISLLPPLLALITVEEITKVYQRSMLEIEYATKYSLQNVVLVRMMVLSEFHCILLAVMLVSIRAKLDSGIGTLFVYGFTPMILMTGILMKLMQHCHGERLRSAGIGVYVLMAMFTIAGNTKYFCWFHSDYFMVWCILCAVSILFAGWQFDCLRRKLVCFEQIAKF